MLMSGLDTLAYALGATIVLMVAVYFLSRILLAYGVLPLASVFSLSGFNTSLLYLLVFPGTVIHELSHYLACILTGVRVKEVRLFSPQKDGTLGWIKSEQADPLRRTIIALAPFVGGSLAIYVLVLFGLPESKIDPLAVAPSDLIEGFRLCFASITTALRYTDLRHWTSWLVLYVLFSLGYAVAPSQQDLAPLAAYGALAIILVVGASAADQHYGWGLAQSSLLNNMAVFLAGIFERLNSLLLFAATVVALATVIIVPFAMVGLWIRGGSSS
jgi:hypothetical protein